jgi:hypothetical protein
MSDTENKPEPAVDNSAQTVKIYDDVPRTAMVVRGKEEARSALVRLRGDQVPNECLFCCIMCGWEGTIRFDAEELAAMGDEVENYAGPCSGVAKDDKGQVVHEKDETGEFVLDAQGNRIPVPCGQLTLLPKRNMGAGEFTPGEQVAKRAKMRELREQAEVNADVFIEKAVQAAASVMTPPAASTPVEVEPSKSE